MPLFQLKFAKTVILTVSTYAEDEEEAVKIFNTKDEDLVLDLDFGTLPGTLYVKDEVTIEDVIDDDAIWDIEEVTE